MSDIIKLPGKIGVDQIESNKVIITLTLNTTKSNDASMLYCYDADYTPAQIVDFFEKGRDCYFKIGEDRGNYYRAWAPSSNYFEQLFKITIAYYDNPYYEIVAPGNTMDQGDQLMISDIYYDTNGYYINFANDCIENILDLAIHNATNGDCPNIEELIQNIPESYAKYNGTVDSGFKGERDLRLVDHDTNKIYYPNEELAEQTFIQNDIKNSQLNYLTIDNQNNYDIIGQGTVNYPSYVTQTDQFLYRKTADGLDFIPGKDAYVTKVKGNTVAWNQLIREEFVDMGLPSGKLWAKKNLDVTQASGFAASEYQYECSFFSWGNTDGHNPSGTTFDYDFGSSSSGPYASTPGAALTSDIGVANDAARFNGGAPWRIPTSSEFAELLANCDFIDANGDVISGTNKLTTINGIAGIYLKSKNNGNKMFMTAVGYGHSNTLMEKGVTGHYWLSEIVTSLPYNAYTLRFVDSSINPSTSVPRFYGFAIRPILTPNINIDGDGHKYYTSPTTGTAYDLTAIFGAGNEPSSVAEFESWMKANLGKTSGFAYDAGSLIPVRMSGLKSVGFNLWDEEWVNGYVVKETGNVIQNSNITIASKNLIPVVSNATYYFKGKGYITLYDTNQAVIGQVQKNNATFNIETNVRYIRFHIDNYGRTYNHDICINFSDASRNGTYEPHKETIAPLPIISLTGKLNGSGNSVKVFPDGLKKVGNVQDEIFVENGVTKAIKRVGSVDMGDWNWQISSTNTEYYAQPHLNNKFSYGTVLCINPKYIKVTTQTDKAIVVISTNGGEYRVRDSSYFNGGTTIAVPASTFKSDMQGVMLYYELDTPETYIIDYNPLCYAKYNTDILGTEEIICNNYNYLHTPPELTIQYGYKETTIPKMSIGKHGDILVESNTSMGYTSIAMPSVDGQLQRAVQDGEAGDSRLGMLSVGDYKKLLKVDEKCQKFQIENCSTYYSNNGEIVANPVITPVIIQEESNRRYYTDINIIGPSEGDQEHRAQLGLTKTLLQGTLESLIFPDINEPTSSIGRTFTVIFNTGNSANITLTEPNNLPIHLQDSNFAFESNKIYELSGRYLNNTLGWIVAIGKWS